MESDESEKKNSTVEKEKAITGYELYISLDDFNDIPNDDGVSSKDEIVNDENTLPLSKDFPNFDDELYISLDDGVSSKDKSIKVSVSLSDENTLPRSKDFPYFDDELYISMDDFLEITNDDVSSKDKSITSEVSVPSNDENTLPMSKDLSTAGENGWSLPTTDLSELMDQIEELELPLKLFDDSSSISTAPSSSSSIPRCLPGGGAENKKNGDRTEKRCSHCGVKKTPQWRNGPLGLKTLCNACGIRFQMDPSLPEFRPANM